MLARVAAERSGAPGGDGSQAGARRGHRRVGRSTRVHFAVPGGTYQRERQRGATYVAVGPPTSPARRRRSRSTARRSASSVGFRPRGHAATFGSVTLRDADGDERRVVVDIAGRMRVE